METTIEKTKVDMVEVFIDPESTGGGIWVNEKLFVGMVKVPRDQAQDLLRIQSEYSETVKKLNNPSVFVRTKSDLTKANRFLANPQDHPQLANTDAFRKYGLLDPRDWGYMTKEGQQRLLDRRKSLYGY